MEDKIAELKIGDKVCLKPLEARFFTTSNLVEGRVEKIGRKYIHVRLSQSVAVIMFDKETCLEYRKDGMSGVWQLFADKQAYLDYEEFLRLAKAFNKLFTYATYNMLKDRVTLEQLRACAKILGIKENQCE